jgi:hypothetical protein
MRPVVDEAVEGVPALGEEVKGALLGLYSAASRSTSAGCSFSISPPSPLSSGRWLESAR